MVMYYDRYATLYGQYSAAINRLYCNKYEMDLVVSSTPRYSGRHPAWERLPLMLETLAKGSYDYMVWVDADAFFYPDAGDIREVIEAHNDSDFIFSMDVHGTADRDINTGLMIVRNSEYAKAFLSRWATDDVLYSSNPYPKWWDQGVLIGMFDADMHNIQEHSVTIPFGTLQHFDENDLKYEAKPYVLHLAGEVMTKRVDTVKRYWQVARTAYAAKTNAKDGDREGEVHK